MKRLRKRALSLFLALVMTVSLLPTGVWAAGATVPAEIPTWIQEKIDSIPEIGSYTKPG